MQQWIIIFYRMDWLAEKLSLNDFNFEINEIHKDSIME